MTNTFPYGYLMGRGFKENAAGPIIYSHTVSVPTSANKKEYKIEEKSTIENHYLVGIWVSDQQGASADFQNNAVVNDQVFHSSFLTLVTEETNVRKRIPFSDIKKANDNGHPYYVNIPEVQMNESIIEIGDVANIAPGEVFLLSFEFPKKKSHGRR